MAQQPPDTRMQSVSRGVARCFESGSRQHRNDTWRCFSFVGNWRPRVRKGVVTRFRVVGQDGEWVFHTRCHSDKVDPPEQSCESVSFFDVMMMLKLTAKVYVNASHSPKSQKS